MDGDSVLFCTDESNDADLVRTLGSMAIALPIASGDVCFSGLGDKGRVILVCCERKKIGDLVSCIQTGRYIHQLQIAKSNGADALCLIVEGQCRPSPDDGLLEVPVWGINSRGRHAEVWRPVIPAMSYSRFDQYLTELDYLVGVIVKRSRDVKETAAIIKALWDNFQTPPNEHQSLHRMFVAPAPAHSVELVRPSLVRRMAKELKGVGWGRSRAVTGHFGSVLEMAQASEEEWKKIPGIGEKVAGSLFSEIRSGGNRVSDTLKDKG